MTVHTNWRGRAAQLHARLEEAATAHQRLTAENAKLREQLAEAVELLSRINYTFLAPYDTAAIDEFVARHNIA